MHVTPPGNLFCRMHKTAVRQRHVQSSGLTLLDIIQEAPALMACLSPGARAALSGCDRQLNAHIRSVTGIIMLSKKSHAAALRTSDWPMLAAVVLRNSPKQSSSFWRGDQLEHVMSLELPDRKEPTQVAVLLIKHKGNFPFPTELLSTVLLHLHQPQYATTCELNFHWPGLDVQTGLDVHSLANLVAAGWKGLRTLSLFHTKLDANAVRCLANGVWPKLSHLNLTLCELDTPAMAELVKGQWPRLKQLDLSANPLDAAALSLLASAHWPKLNYLQLTSMELRSGSFDWLLRKEWKSLSHLDLQGTDISAPIMFELALTHPSHIDTLDMADNELGSDAMSDLVTASMPVWPVWTCMVTI